MEGQAVFRSINSGIIGHCTVLPSQVDLILLGCPQPTVRRGSMPVVVFLVILFALLSFRNHRLCGDRAASGPRGLTR